MESFMKEKCMIIFIIPLLMIEQKVLISCIENEDMTNSIIFHKLN